MRSTYLKKLSKKDRKSRMYYLSSDIVEALDNMSFYEKIEKSDIVEEALKQYIPSKYLIFCNVSITLSELSEASDRF